MMKISKKIGLILAFLLSFSACQRKAPVKRHTEWLNTMEMTFMDYRERSDLGLQEFKLEVKKNGNSREGLERVKRVILLKKRTADLLNGLSGIKNGLIERAGGGLDGQTNLPKTPQNKAGVQKEMQQRLADLITLLDRYVSYLNKEFKDLDLPRFETLTKGREYPKMSFYEVYYKNANVLEALASLTTHQLEILRYEREIMFKLGVSFSRIDRE